MQKIYNINALPTTIRIGMQSTREPPQSQQPWYANAMDATRRAEEAAASVEDGGYYEPSVSQTGLLTWNPSKEGMPFPNAVNIQGLRGMTGATGGTPTFDISRIIPSRFIECTRVHSESHKFSELLCQW